MSVTILEGLPVLWNKQPSKLLLRPMDLARTSPGRLLDRDFPENHLFGLGKISMKIFQF